MVVNSQGTASAILSINKSRTHSEASSRIKKGRNEVEEWLPKKTIKTQNSRKTKIETGGVNLDLEELSPEPNGSVQQTLEGVMSPPATGMFKITHAIISQESFKNNSPVMFKSSDIKRPNLIVSQSPQEHQSPLPGTCTSLHEIVDG
jgi:hypothetical protein